MCGRYLLSYDLSKIIEELKKQWDNIDTDKISDFNPSYNIGPTQKIYGISKEGNSFKTESFKWGVPYTNFTMINTKSESIVSGKNSIINNFKPCLILANGFYEWKKEKKESKPYVFFLNNFSMFYFLGIYTKLQNQLYCSIITSTPSELIKDIHNRMPVIKVNSKKEWLVKNLKSYKSLDYFKPFSDSSFNRYRVSSYVNKAYNDDEKCLEPFTDEQLNFFS
jgi:putative SOS response-associated peptidase YedK